MCLKFDPEENILKQTCSGKCKNKCGFKPNDDTSLSLMKVQKVRISISDHGSSQLKNTPIRSRAHYFGREIITSPFD